MASVRDRAIQDTENVSDKDDYDDDDLRLIKEANVKSRTVSQSMFALTKIILPGKGVVLMGTITLYCLHAVIHLFFYLKSLP